jgi:carnitine 3-dehydrogenase
MQALRTHNAGAGEALSSHERNLFDSAHRAVMRDGDDVSYPLRLHRARIPAEWVDYNGHVTESRYHQILSDATDAFLHYLGIDAAYLARGCSYFTAEAHLSFLNQTRAEDVVEVSTQLLASDEKKLHLYHKLERPGDGAVLAESEHLLLHFDMNHGRTTPAGPEVLERIGLVQRAHSRLPKPERAGRRIGDPRT